MQETNGMRDRLINEFAENYMEKLFYFCLKKTGNQVEAEDLTQEIALQIITALNKGTIPTSFSAWVWQIARNCYAKWAKEKHSQNESVTGSDIGDYEIEDESENILDEMIHTEQMALLRRELAFIKSDYRNIVVAYYIENKSVRDIASSLSLSISAVQQRLHRARILLKEGMDMAREFGRLSYKPEEVNFISNGLFGKNNEPSYYLSRSLCKNILLAAHRTPSTAEELAMEVGVALPYMEEELSALVRATLMQKKGDRYQTNFFIVSAEAQGKIYAHLRGLAPELTKVIIEKVEFNIAWLNKTNPGWHEGYQSLDDMKWALLMMETDATNFHTLNEFHKDAKKLSNIGPWGHTIRPNGGEWDILGLEEYSGDKPSYVGLSGCVSTPKEKDLPRIDFRQYRFKCYGLNERTSHDLNYADGQGMVAVANRKSGEVDKAILNRLEVYGYIKKVNGEYVPTIMVVRQDKVKEKTSKMSKEEQEKHESLRSRAKDIATRHYLFCREQIYNEIPEFLKEDEFQIDHACTNIFSMRGAVLEEAIRQGYLTFDKDDNKQMLGAYLIV